MNKKMARIMLTVLVVAFVGREVQIMVINALNEKTEQHEVIRRLSRNKRRKP